MHVTLQFPDCNLWEYMLRVADSVLVLLKFVFKGGQPLGNAGTIVWFDFGQQDLACVACGANVFFIFFWFGG